MIDRTGHKRTAIDRDVLSWIARASHAHHHGGVADASRLEIPGGLSQAEYGFQTDCAGSIPVRPLDIGPCLLGYMPLGALCLVPGSDRP